jgi:phospholipase C
MRHACAWATSLAVFAVSIGCGSSSDESQALTTDGGDAEPADSHVAFDAFDSTSRDVARDTAPDAPGDTWKPGVPPPYDTHAHDRDLCLFGPGDLTTKTIGPSVPHGDALPFKHVVVLMMENESFDRYLSQLPRHGVTDVDVAPADASNPEPGSSTPVKRFVETRYCIADLNHEWSGVHLQYDDGAMDGFVATNEPGGARAMGYYDEADLPFSYWLANGYAISDRHFSGCLGPTWPNRFFLYGATAWGRTNTPDTPPFGNTQILSLMEDAGHSWKIYREGLTSFADAFGPKYVGDSFDEFDTDAFAGALPDLAMIDPKFSGSGQDDEHPPSNVQLGQKLIAHVVETLIDSPSWDDTVLFITYDEHGGFYDHVVPPPACIPDGENPPDFAYDRYGIRVPLYVVSKFAKAHYVSHFVTDHTSITRFIENRFDLGAMTVRDANAWPMLDLFDFDHPPHVTPDLGWPSAEPSADGVTWCSTHPPGTGMP